jgi:hypothetical protein
MEARVYANKSWQHIGKVTEDGKIYAEGEWCFRDNQRADRTCNASGRSDSKGNYWPTPVSDDDGCPYKGPDAKVGQLVMKDGENGDPQGYDQVGFQVTKGMDVWMTINDDYFDNNDGYLDLRFVSKSDSWNTGQRILSDAEKGISQKGASA